ncbi:MAG: M56 family metallopeptidase [Planctomycetota bacterium]
MMDGALLDILWRNAVLLVPLAALVIVVGRTFSLKSSARHALWVGLLMFLAFQPMTPEVTTDDLRSAVALAQDLMPDEATKPVAHRPQPGLASEPLVVGKPRHGSSGEAIPTVTTPETATAAVDRLKAAVHDRRAHVGDVPTDALSMLALPSDSASNTPATPAVVAADASSIRSNARAFMMAWRDQLIIARDTVMALPALPTSIWLLGSVTIFLLIMARMISFRAVVFRSVAAPTDVRAMVGRVARSLEIQCPDVRMSSHKVTPMVWCGLKPRLILPESLWAQLDDDAREAIIVHELAHVRRRDHRVCWLDLIVACIYWWHPVVWWIRHQMRTDADASCDAWVVALRPDHRRAYAQALLETRTYMNNSSMALMPAVGLGGPSRHARQLARRITMVMTQDSQPRLSRRGLALASTLLAVACLITPALACDEKPRCDEKKQKIKLRVKTPAPCPPKASPTPPAAPTPAAVPDFDDDETSFEQYMRQLEDGSQNDDLSLDARLELLERRLAAIQSQIESYADQIENESDDTARVARTVNEQIHGVQRDLARIRVTTADGVRVVSTPLAPTGVTLRASSPSCQPQPSCQSGPAVTTITTTTAGAPSAYGVSAGQYAWSEATLNNCKRKQLMKLMSEGDSAIAISMEGNAVRLYGTPMQRQSFSAFCAMIDDDDRYWKTYEMPSERLEPMNSLMRRSDVPIYVKDGCGDSIQVKGNDLEQSVFAAFVRLLDESTESVNVDVVSVVR